MASSSLVWEMEMQSDSIDGIFKFVGWRQIGRKSENKNGKDKQIWDE